MDLPLNLEKCKISFMKKLANLILRSTIFLIFIFLFILFYLRYVPTIRGFQIILFPLVLFIFFVTLFKRKAGILFLVFLIPVVNSIPYFFHVKSAPIGVVLFLSLFLSLVTRWTIFGEKSFKFPSIPFFSTFFFIALISVVISFLRYANFFPFRDNSIHEWVVNSANLRAGGAIFSVITESLIVLSGLLFLSMLMVEKDENFLLKLMFSLTAGLSISSFFSIFQIINGFAGVEDFWVRLKRVNGLATDPNSLGISISLIIPFLLFLIFEKRKLFPLLLIPLFLVSLFLSGSRSGFGNLVFSTLFYLYLFFKSRKKRIVLTFAVILIFVFTIFSLPLLKPEKFNLSKRLLKSWSELRERKFESFLMGRHILWKAGLLMAKEYPVSGVGLGAYIVELPNFYKKYNLINMPSLDEYKKGYPPPFTDTSGSLYLQFLSEIGFIGLSAFSIFWFYILISALKRNLNPFASSAILSFSLISLLGFHILNPDVLFPVFILLSFLIVEREKTKFLNYFQILFVLVFSISFFIASVNSLSIKKRTEEFGWEQDYGLYKLERYENGFFRWTKKGAGFEALIQSPFFTIDYNASHPDLEKKPVKVKFFISEKPFEKKKKVDEFVIREKGWIKRGYYLKEFSGKKAFLSFEVSRTWRPLKVLRVPDPRNIGIGIGKIDFEAQEAGFYNWERDNSGINFRWTADKAWIKLKVTKDVIIFPVRVLHPDVGKKSVELIVSINDKDVEREIFNDHNWYEIELNLSDYYGKEVFIKFSVSRTWCPLNFGINDKRDLGVSVGEFE